MPQMSRVKPTCTFTAALPACAVYSKCGFSGCAGDSKMASDVRSLMKQYPALEAPNQCASKAWITGVSAWAGRYRLGALNGRVGRPRGSGSDSSGGFDQLELCGPLNGTPKPQWLNPVRMNTLTVSRASPTLRFLGQSRSRIDPIRVPVGPRALPAACRSWTEHARREDSSLN